MKKALVIVALLLVPTVPALAQEDFTVTEEDKGILNCGQADWYPPDCTGYPQPWVINPEVIQYDNSGSRAQEEGEGIGYYPPEGGHCTYWPDLGGTVCGNEPITQNDITGWYWSCGAPEGQPELTHCEWAPAHNLPGRAQ
jgi:hypothetical protein